MSIPIGFAGAPIPADSILCLGGDGLIYPKGHPAVVIEGLPLSVFWAMHDGEDAVRDAISQALSEWADRPTVVPAE